LLNQITLVTNSRLKLYINQKRNITNHDLSAPAPYYVSISGDAGWYDASGIINSEAETSGNYFYESVTEPMVFDLPYSSGTQESPNIYELSMYYYDQASGVTPTPLIFNTKDIKTSIDDFDDGVLDEFTDINVKRIGEIPIKSDVVAKKRFSIGIEDLASVSETYAKQGVFISEFYTVDDPIYTFMLKVAETIPSVAGLNDYSMVKYSVQFQNQDWIRLSPISRSEELDDNDNIIPKFFVLDNLNLGQISSDLAEVPFDFPIYSFRIRIEFDMSSISESNFISPSIDYYECHVTDRNSFLKV